VNALDLCILIVMALCAFGGYRQGLIRTVYRLASFFVAIFLAHRLYPYAAGFLRETALFSSIRDGIARAMNFEAVFNDHAASLGAGLIDTLPLPGALSSLLHSHNTPDMFALFQVATIEEYIASFFANMVINALAILLVFMIAMLVLTIAGSVLDIVGMLPVIRTLNRAGGLALGLVMGAVIVWVSIIVMTLLFTAGVHPGLYDWMQGSVIIRWVFDNEFVLPRLVAV